MREMKDTEICWCKNIPSDWSLMRVKDLARLQSGDTFTADDLVEEGLYPVYGGNGLRGYADRYTNDGDHVLIGRQGALCGNINYGAGKFFATEHAIVVYSKKGINVRWLGETLRTANLNRLSMTAAQPGLSVSVINNQFIPCPPEEEQRRIAEYLDSHVSSIDKRVSLLATKRDHYLRLKTAIINRAVTQGLIPDVKMKDSGVEWIGMIPEHWEIKRIKEIGKLRLGKMLTERPKDGYVLKPYLKSKNVSWLNLNLDSVEEMYFSVQELKELRLHSGDLVITEGGEVGKTAIWREELKECYIQNSVHKLTFKSFCDSRYYCYFSFFLGQKDFYKSIVNLVSIMHLTYEKLRRLSVPVPPLSEQQAIANYLDEKCAKLDVIVENLNQQIEKHKLLKRSLINEVITGQRAV